MKIEKLIIYGFGKHENVTVEFGAGINVLYGLNEAGKTTIQQFILHVLFGFPQRNSAALRYEPKLGGKYGGQIQLMDDRYGRCSIERVRGKSAGDVTVHFEDGTRGGEEALKELLRQYDRASFESIFSFSLLQLQGFEKMDEDELSRTLLASGTTGVDSLLQVGKQMEKEMGELFKKSGRNPAMNVKMEELRTLEKELKDEHEKVAEYEPSIERIYEIDTKLSLLRKEEGIHQEQLRQLSVSRQLLPLQQEKEVLEKHLVQLREVGFPSDGIRRFESLSGKLIETKATKQRIEEELAEMEARLPKHDESERILAIGILLAKESEWHGWRSSVVAENDELRRLNGLKHRLFDRLGVREEEIEKVLFDADVSIRKEEEMHELLNEMNETNNQLGFLEKQLTTVENELIEAKLKSVSIEVPSDEQIKQAREWPGIRQKLAEAKAYVSFGRSGTNKNTQTLPIMLFVLALLFIGMGVIQKGLPGIVIGIIIGGIGAFLYSKKDNKDDLKLKEMEDFISRYRDQEHEMEKLMEQIEAYDRDKGWLEEEIKGLEQKFKTLELKHDNLHIRSHQTESVFDEFIHSYGFDGLPSTGIVPELFRMIRDVQEVGRDMREVSNRKHMIENNLANRIEDVEEILKQFAPPEAVYELLRKEYNHLTEEFETKKTITAGMQRLRPMLKETTALLGIQQESLQALLDEANVETEEDFYSAYDVHQRVIRIKEQLSAIEAQMTASGPQHLAAHTTEDEVMRKVAESETALSSIDEKSTNLIYEKASLVTKTEELLSDETYSQKLQLFEMKKSELALLAKKWSARKAILEAINQTMSELKEGKLPEVLHGAEKMFAELTGGTYEALVVTEEGKFEAVTANGMRYPIVELSQATKEQAYISLRLSLAESVLETAPFPIIMDDPFVHFDGERLSRMIELLGAIKDHQFIYFTCHSKMKEKWTDGKIINVSEIGNEQGAFVQ